MIRFQKIPPTEIDNLDPLAVKFLDEAIKRTPASTSRLDVTLDIAKKGYGNIYTIHDEDSLVGATYLLVYPTPQGKVVGIVLLGGRKLESWKHAYYNFAVDFANKLDAIAIRFISRDGWGKKYPMCKRIGGIYELKLGVA